jgi:iron complex transport system permease protein
MHFPARQRLIKPLLFATLTLTLIFALPLSVTVGSMDISKQQAMSAMLDVLGLSYVDIPNNILLVIQQIRMPRSILAVLVGAGMALSGAAIQGLFRNPLADPGLIGVSGGAALAAVSMIVLGQTIFAPIKAFFDPYSITIAAFIGGILSTLLVSRIATSKFGTSMVTMLLAGIAINVITGACIGIFTYVADDQQLRTLTFWSMGSLGGATWEAVQVAGITILATILLIPTKAKDLNALLLGESEARHLGINVNRVKIQVILLSALAVGACVAVAGMIAFVGFIVPHLVRLSVGPDHRFLLPTSALLGSLFLLCADMLSRTLIAPAELPIGLITSIIGGPLFIGLVISRAKRFSI